MDSFEIFCSSRICQKSEVILHYYTILDCSLFAISGQLGLVVDTAGVIGVSIGLSIHYYIYMDTATVSEPVTCPFCHTGVAPTDYFCANCGKALKPKPPSTTFARQCVLYLGSFMLPPLGIIWAIPYLRVDNQKSKIIGWVAITLTLLSTIFTIKITADLIQTINETVNSQLQNFGGF